MYGTGLREDSVSSTVIQSTFSHLAVHFYKIEIETSCVYLPSSQKYLWHMFVLANALKLFSIEDANKITIKPQNMDHNYDLN